MTAMVALRATLTETAKLAIRNGAAPDKVNICHMDNRLAGGVPVKEYLTKPEVGRNISLETHKALLRLWQRDPKTDHRQSGKNTGVLIDKGTVPLIVYFTQRKHTIPSTFAIFTFVYIPCSRFRRFSFVS